MFEGAEWEWSQDWLESLVGRSVRGARPTDVADALVQVDAREFLTASEGVAEEAISTLQQAINQLTALQQVFIEAFARRKEREWEVARSVETEAGRSPFGFWTADDFIPSMLAPILHLSPRTMSGRVDDARRLVNHLPQTLDTALAGDAEPWRVSAVVSASELVSSARVADFEAELYAARPGAPEGGLGDSAAGAVRARAERVAARVDPESVAGRVTRGRQVREVRVQPGPYPGTTSWSALAPAGRSGEAWQAICDLAADYCAADRSLTMSQARADAFLDLLLAQVQVSTTVVVTVSDESFDGQGLAADSGLAGTLVGDEVSRLLADPAVRLRMARLHAATGATAYLSQESYRPGKELDRLVRERDGTCRFPGCGVPAARCDIDHAVEFPRGPTDIRNLHCLCRRHHGFKHHAGWRVDLAWDGTLTWTSPTGRDYVTFPADRRDVAA